MSLEHTNVRDELVSLTRTLVSIPSHRDATAVGDVIYNWIENNTDAAAQRDSHGNIIARRGIGSVSVALTGHHDVVDPDEQQVTDNGEYQLTKQNRRLYGRGTADMKGSLAAALLAFRDIVPADGIEVVFASFIGEEDGGIGAQAAIENGFSPEYAIVGEGSTNYAGVKQTDVVVAHKGRRGSTLTAHGEAAHASEVDCGINAIYRASDAIDILQELAADAPVASVGETEISGSVAVTEIDGGTAWNTIPDTCQITIDERTVPGKRAPIERAAVEGVTWSIDQDLPPMACDDPTFATAVTNVAANIHSETTPTKVTKPHATDAGWLSDAGTTCVIVGAAEPGEAHTAQESVSIDAIERCYQIYRAVPSQHCIDNNECWSSD
ncbi:M20 family metallopeptidase [Haloquadratum walsbyi]|jgi:acetylornithine deacetylase|uniref:M20 family metallopeptidase n=1 Tax=Haloquadratum walsbyi TaxID=293091 RepID=UPI0015F7803E|nr:M20/M25/M40 family metallo-hydrolase [Haloquadratum walsbyi]